MTYTEAYSYIDDLLDKSGTAYFTDDEKMRFVDLAVMEFTKGLINTLETDTESQHKIAPLVTKSSSLVQSSNTVSYPSRFYHLLRAWTASTRVPVKIVTMNEFNAQQNDPYHKGTSEHPVGLLTRL
jgi:hypothetical protein